MTLVPTAERRQIVETTADILVCLGLLRMEAAEEYKPFYAKRMAAKMERWANRVEGGK